MSKGTGSKSGVGGYDSIVTQLANETDLDVDQLQILFENIGGRIGETITNFERIMSITTLRNLLCNYKDHSNKINLKELSDFFQQALEGNIETFEIIINYPGLIELFNNSEGINIETFSIFCKQLLDLYDHDYDLIKQDLGGMIDIVNRGKFLDDLISGDFNQLADAWNNLTEQSNEMWDDMLV